ncbi:G protein-coupled receptor gpr1 [Lithohypha guttulata]|uniref:G protein-coupled receptor gpr1 n=1 Tax=Lithohypha guttulata TaxID=1690604 RepID=A0AAN7Y6G2_9EURO|nr:G protein-coupled receptor gpr1 [Lithohypha guttulata]
MSLTIRSLNAADPNRTSLTREQNRGILIAGLTCACFSVLATLITLRWFILMKRAFRHKLVMFLILSDTFKAFWYFIFPVVVFSQGPVQNSSGFCQASGFFLALGIEASDYAILMIALHSLIYIFNPPASSGDNGGLYRYRKYIYPCWVVFPVLAASLAFVNNDNGYTTAGTFCYLPRRPFWYRLALSWIPRYCIITLIFTMYLAVYIYVALKFRSFNYLHEDSSNFSSGSPSRRSSISDDNIAPDEHISSEDAQARTRFGRPVFSRSASYNQQPNQMPRELDPWEQVSFITSKGLRTNDGSQAGIETSDFPMRSQKHSISAGTTSPQTTSQYLPGQSSPPQGQEEPPSSARMSQLSGETRTVPAHYSMNQVPPMTPKAFQSASQPKPQDPLQSTRKAIRKQLRYLFIYPAVYVLMWLFPFVSHCLLYNDYYVQNPIYWLTVAQTCSVSLQAGVDCVIFSWREKPWRRIPEGRKFSLNKVRHSFSLRGDNRQGSAVGSFHAMPEEELGQASQNQNTVSSSSSNRGTSANWWEAEGRRRKDSVWMGTDADYPDRRETLAQIPSTAPVAEEAGDHEDASRPQKERSAGSLSTLRPEEAHNQFGVHRSNRIY